jgi:hypothetical protein
MVDAGLVSVILDLVNQCNQTIVDVVETEGHILPYKKNRFHKSVLGGVEEGYLDDPVPWFDILSLVLVRAEMRGVGKKKIFYIKRKIARGIGPAVKCLHDDMYREFFQENELWHSVYLPFTRLLFHVVEDEIDQRRLGRTPELISALIEHEGLLEMLIRPIFWAEQRPDIMEEATLAGSDTFSWARPAKLADYSGAVIEQIVLSSLKDDEGRAFYEGAGKECNMNICGTMIVNEAYDSSAKVFFGTGVVNLLLKSNIENDVRDATQLFERNTSLWRVMRALAITGCVEADESLFQALVDSAGQDTISYDYATKVVEVIFLMTQLFVREKRSTPDDRRVAMVVKTGYLELVLELLVRFKHQANITFVSWIGMTVQNIQSFSYEKRTAAAAITSRREIIAAALNEYEEKEPRLSNIKLQSKYDDISSMIRSIVYYSEIGSRLERDMMAKECFDCYGLPSEEAKGECRRCNDVCTCEEENGQCIQTWRASEAQKAACQTANIHRIGAIVANENLSQVVVDATLKDLDIQDCVVKIDLRVGPPDIRVVRTSAFLIGESHLPSSVRRSIEKVKGGYFILLYRDSEHSFDELHGDFEYWTERGARSTSFSVPHFVQFGSGNYITWVEAQEQLKSRFAGTGGMDKLKSNPEFGKQFLEKSKNDFIRGLLKQKYLKRDPNMPPIGLEMVLDIMEEVGFYDYSQDSSQFTDRFETIFASPETLKKYFDKAAMKVFANMMTEARRAGINTKDMLLDFGMKHYSDFLTEMVENNKTDLEGALDQLLSNYYTWGPGAEVGKAFNSITDTLPDYFGPDADDEL